MRMNDVHIGFKDKKIFKWVYKYDSFPRYLEDFVIIIPFHVFLLYLELTIGRTHLI